MLVLVDVLDYLSVGNPVVQMCLKLFWPRHNANAMKLIGRGLEQYRPDGGHRIRIFAHKI